MILAPALVALAVFFACVGAWPPPRARVTSGWSADRLRQQFRAQVRRARLRSIR